MGGKGCGKGCDHGHHCEWKKRLGWICGGFLAIILVITFAIFLVWIILQPSKPKFVLQDTTLNNLTLSIPNCLTTYMQVTIASRNSNKRIGIYYERLDIYASYRDQQITLATELPMSYQGHKDNTVWSPFLCGNDVPLSPLLAAALTQDLNAGILLLKIKVDGRLKWKVGSWMSGNYHLNVNCPAYLSHCYPNMCVGQGIKYHFAEGCTVEASL